MNSGTSPRIFDTVADSGLDRRKGRTGEDDDAMPSPAEGVEQLSLSRMKAGCWNEEHPFEGSTILPLCLPYLRLELRPVMPEF
jgi:hypothetical protein